MTVCMGITETNLYKLVKYGVKIDTYDKLNGIREFSEQLALDCLNDPLTADTGTPQNSSP